MTVKHSVVRHRRHHYSLSSRVENAAMVLTSFCWWYSLIRALGISTLSYAWWMFTNKEYQYSNIFDFFFNKMIQGKYKAGGLDLNLLAETQVRATNNHNETCDSFFLLFPIFILHNNSSVVVTGVPFKQDHAYHDREGYLKQWVDPTMYLASERVCYRQGGLGNRPR